MMNAEMDARLKEGVKWLWSLGDYGEVAERLWPAAEALAEAIGVGPGMRVLDVAAGNGNFALAAARGGADVVASDLTPRMVALGRGRSEAEGLEVEWREADAEALPFDAGSFAVVASVFGAMFAPRPERVASELFRVARSGGLVAMANYATDGFLARLAALIAHFGPPAPAPLPSPFRWGDADDVRERFQGRASSIAVERRSLTFAFDSPAQGLAFWERTNPALIALQRFVPAATYGVMMEEITRLLADENRADDGCLTLDIAYLQIIARKK